MRMLREDRRDSGRKGEIGVNIEKHDAFANIVLAYAVVALAWVVVIALFVIGVTIYFKWILE